MCKSGVIFDIKEFAVYDGPGIRTTVFMKGCPLRCQWCHNPEGLSMRPQLMVSAAACTHCGKCRQVCEHKNGCISCGKCIPACHLGLRRIAGTPWQSDQLAAYLMRQLPLLQAAEGGVTFSGGEPLMQWPFVRDVIRQMPGMHTCIQTSGYASDETFREVIGMLSMVMMDVKLVDAGEHLRWTGRDNAPILRHLEMLCRSDTPFIIRMPIIPGVNDHPAHFEAVASLLEHAPALVRVELLPYHQTAGAKYAMVSMEYNVDFDPNKPVIIDQEPFRARGIPCIAL